MNASFRSLYMCRWHGNHLPYFRYPLFLTDQTFKKCLALLFTSAKLKVHAFDSKILATPVLQRRNANVTINLRLDRVLNISPVVGITTPSPPYPQTSVLREYTLACGRGDVGSPIPTR